MEILKLIIAGLILIVAACNATDAAKKRHDMLEVGVTLYWCLVTGYWAVNMIGGMMK